MLRGTRERYPRIQDKTAVVAEFSEAYFVRSASDPRTRLSISLGFVLPGEISRLADDRDGTETCEEELGLLDRDLLLWNIGSYPQLENELAGNEIHGQLDVAREGRDTFFTDEVVPGARAWSTVLSIPYALERLASMLAAAAVGDPATAVERAAG